METQNVTPGNSGHYAVQLGATSANGLPADLFVSGDARWLAVQVFRARRASPGDAGRGTLCPEGERRGDDRGLPPSAFVQAGPGAAVVASNKSTGPITAPRG
jgi:hypothetical protein